MPSERTSFSANVSTWSPGSAPACASTLVYAAAALVAVIEFVVDDQGADRATAPPPGVMAAPSRAPSLCGGKRVAPTQTLTAMA
jgi:hypothetical protein